MLYPCDFIGLPNQSRMKGQYYSRAQKWTHSFAHFIMLGNLNIKNLTRMRKDDCRSGSLRNTERAWPSCQGPDWVPLSTTWGSHPPETHEQKTQDNRALHTFTLDIHIGGFYLKKPRLIPFTVEVIVQSLVI